MVCECRTKCVLVGLNFNWGSVLHNLVMCGHYEIVVKYVILQVWRNNVQVVKLSSQ